MALEFRSNSSSVSRRWGDLSTRQHLKAAKLIQFPHNRVWRVYAIYSPTGRHVVLHQLLIPSKDTDNRWINAMNQRLLKFLHEEDGPTAVEYAVMLALIIMAMFGTIAFFGSSAGGSFVDSSDKISNAFTAAGLP